MGDHPRNQEPPEVCIEGQLYRSSTIPQLGRNSTSDAESTRGHLPAIPADDNTPLDELLREHKIDGADGGFWPYTLLRHILTRERVLAKLKTYEDLEDAETYLNYIHPNDDELSKDTSTYLITFALLLLYERGEEIANFIKEEVSDQILPVCLHAGSKKGQVNLCRPDKLDQQLECFQKWKSCDRDGFENTQWQFLAPYFDLDGYSARCYKLHDRIVLPWWKKDNHSHSSPNPSGETGGYAFVSCVKIHPCSHGFHDVLHGIRLTDDRFALKMLHEKSFNDKARFENEMDQLNRFNGLVHDHLVTLLATFTHKRKYHFLFPYADGGTLEQYWDDQVPSRDLVTIRWISKQCSGIMAAINTIHEPKHLKNLNVSKYGRHGDIKPDNILWFRSSGDPKGILVISDMGLSSFNSDKSRSNIPNSRITGAPPGYRPPECDLDGGTISRAFDIWTLGCLYLEMFTWLLGGRKLLEKFQAVRSTEHYITGSKNDIFFDLKTVKGQNGYVVQVKPQVTKWFDTLHNHADCTDFIHAILDIIEKEMIIVLSEGKLRASSYKLRQKFNKVHSRCMDDNDTDYCLKATPRPIPPSRAATAVEANLTEIAKLTIAERQPDLPRHDPTHDGRIRTSMRSEQLASMDQYGPIIYEEPGHVEANNDLEGAMMQKGRVPEAPNSHSRLMVAVRKQ